MMRKTPGAGDGRRKQQCSEDESDDDHKGHKEAPRQAVDSRADGRTGGDGGGAGPSNAGRSPPPNWNPNRPGYMDLVDAVAYRAKYGISAVQGLRSCWGPGLLGTSPVYCNMVFRGRLAAVVERVRQEHSIITKAIVTCNVDNPTEQQRAAVMAFEEELRAAATQRMQAAAEERRKTTGREQRANKELNPSEILKNLPEIIPTSTKVEVVRVGEEDQGGARSPWDDVPAMRGQASLRVKPGCKLAAGEIVGVYSGEVWFDWEYPTLAEPNGADVWDDPAHPTPYPYGMKRVYDFDRYGCNILASSAMEVLEGKLDVSTRKKLESLGRDRSLITTAARLGCPVSMANDPRRTVDVSWDAEPDFHKDGPNSEVLEFTILKCLPVLVMVTTKAIDGGKHITWDYTAGYWANHAEQAATCAEIEGALKKAADERRARQALEKELRQLRAVETPRSASKQTAAGPSAPALAAAPTMPRPAPATAAAAGGGGGKAAASTRTPLTPKNTTAGVAAATPRNLHSSFTEATTPQRERPVAERQADQQPPPSTSALLPQQKQKEKEKEKEKQKEKEKEKEKPRQRQQARKAAAVAKNEVIDLSVDDDDD